MATEKRLIDANAFREFLEVIRQDYREEDTLSSCFAACLIETVQAEYLALAPTVDAVEVVRCKDCKWYNRNEDIMPQSGSCEFHEMVKMDWDFCSRAKMDGDGNA